MYIVTNCKNCSSSIRVFAPLISDRSELVRTKGSSIKVKCKSCGDLGSYHPNDFFKKVNHRMNLIYLVLATSIAICSTFFLTKNYFSRSIFGFLPTLLSLTLPFAIYFVLLKTELNKVKRFNRYKVR